VDCFLEDAFGFITAGHRLVFFPVSGLSFRTMQRNRLPKALGLSSVAIADRVVRELPIRQALFSPLFALTPNRESARNRAMKTNRLLLATTALLFTAAAASFAAIPMMANPMMGTWKLNEAKSKFSPGATKNHTVSYTEAKGGKTMVTVDGMDKDGKAVHWSWTGKFDGQSYKTKGNPIADSAVYNPVNDRTNHLTLMKNGKTIVTGTIAVSKDGKSRTVTTTMTDASGKKHTDKAYYDKQ
jgi:hypothetical protein